MKKIIGIILLSIVLSALIGITIFAFYSAGFNVFWSIFWTLIIYLGGIVLYLSLDLSGVL